MNIGRVCGTVVSTVQHSFYDGRKQLIVRYTRPDGSFEGDKYVIAVDLVGAGMGQTVKACLQSIIGSVFSATCEAAGLAGAAGVSGQVLYDVVSTSGAGSGVVNVALENIIDRQFAGTGSHISTMHKDLGISLGMARDLGVPLFTAATAMQLFQAAKTKYLEGDNWVMARLVEDIIDVELHRGGPVEA